MFSFRGWARLACMYAVSISIISAASAQTILYVDDDAPPKGDGLSWNTAFDNLQSALDAAAAPSSGVSEIHVAQGRYVPTTRDIPDDPRSVTFHAIPNVVLLGGYAGVLSATPDQRNIVGYSSVLSGDLNNDDTTGHHNDGDNAYHVIVMSVNSGTLMLNGLVISGGNAGFALPSIPAAFGGGLWIGAASAQVVDCEFRANRAVRGGGAYVGASLNAHFIRCSFDDNLALAKGSGFYSKSATEVFLDSCTFSANSGDLVAGAGAASEDVLSMELYACSFESNTAAIAGALHVVGLHDPSQSLIIEQCTFVHNQSSSGGAIIAGNLGPTTIAGSYFVDNSSTATGGAIQLGKWDTTGPTQIINSVFNRNSAVTIGGAVVDSSALLIVENCSFSRNSAAQGGAIYGHSASMSQIRFSSFAGNVNPFYAYGTSLNLSHCVIWGNTGQVVQVANDNGHTGSASAYKSDIQTGWAGSSSEILSVNPLFIQPGCDNLRLAFGSLCIDVGNNSDVPPELATDLDGAPRIQGNAVDLGAFEGGHDLLLMEACVDNLGPGESLTLVPQGGGANLQLSATVQFVNNTENQPADATATIFPGVQHEDASGYDEVADALIFECSLSDGQFWARVAIPFTSADLGSLDPTSLDLIRYQMNDNSWRLGPSSNTSSSPGFPTNVGDRFVVIGTTPGGLSYDLGDHGVFWNPDQQRGFVWANIDVTGEFAVGSQITCSADLANGDSVVNGDDLAVVIAAWGLAGSNVAGDINHDGIVNIDDLVIIVLSWGACAS
ncbi:MAG TPA: right-handed parallel beta-helix repeat-containing protein [Phycisphaerales bacterium]|nr:right-handed parallel beta-helix repeat-containing protein [Phycisphaerales bacterium]